MKRIAEKTTEKVFIKKKIGNRNANCADVTMDTKIQGILIILIFFISLGELFFLISLDRITLVIKIL